MDKGMKICLAVVAVFVVAVLGLGFLNNGSDDTSDITSDFESNVESAYNDYNLHFDNVKPVSSALEFSKNEAKSTTYGYFDSVTGEYAEPAYSRSVSEYALIEIDISKMKLSNDSYVDDSAGKNTKDGNIYNQSHLKKDIKSILKGDKYPASLTLYDKHGNVIATLTKVKVSLDGNILTAKYSFSGTSDYYTEYERNNQLSTKFDADSFATNDDFHEIKKAKLSISGSTDDRDSNRTVSIDIDTKNLKVSSSVSTNFKSTYDK
jgi:hypothetical protein